MAQSNEEQEAVNIGYEVAEAAYRSGDIQLANRFRRIAASIRNQEQLISAKRRRTRNDIVKHTEELHDFVQTKYSNLEFRCIDDYERCKKKQKKERKSAYLCAIALFICIARRLIPFVQQADTLMKHHRTEEDDE
jgi:hypothetical protein